MSLVSADRFLGQMLSGNYVPVVSSRHLVLPGPDSQDLDTLLKP